MKTCLIFLAMAVGCESTRPVVRYPGLATQPGEATCVLREADHCFIGSIDDHPIEQYDVNILSPATYRQYRVPAGKHKLDVFFRQDRNGELVSGGPRHVAVDVHGDQCYVIKANLNAMDVAFGDILSTVSWQPSVVDRNTGICAGQATLNVQ